jgi:GTP-binding protein LepA
MEISKIRNFCIIAHVDHGKSTLADRFLEITQTVPKEKMHDQYLDRLSLERERGITIKMQPVTMYYKGYTLNLIDTPGHVDFSYEVSRSLMAVEGAILLIDGTQGIQAQTISHLNLAKSLGLVIIPAINKIDLKDNLLDLDLLQESIKHLIDVDKIYLISAKNGQGVEELIQAIIEKIPPPRILSESKALIFDSHYDEYLGIVAHVRVFGGEFKQKDTAYLLHGKTKFKIVSLGYFRPDLEEKDKLKAGEIGFIATGIRDPGVLKIGDTISLSNEISPLPGYKEPQPVVFACIFPEKENYEQFKEKIQKLRLTDPAVYLEPTISPIFGRGYLAGFLGLLHLEIFTQRLERDYYGGSGGIILTLPSVRYKVNLKDGKSIFIRNPNDLPDPNFIESIEEPWAKVEIITPFDYIENIANLIKEKRGLIKEERLEGHFLIIESEIPVEELITGFYDELKSLSSGYASLSWEFSEYRKGDLVKLNILIAEAPESALSRIVPREKAEALGRKILLKLKELLPREEFPVKLQAAIGSRVIARETIPALRKDVAGWLYGGDRTRKMKLWQKQKEGKKKLAILGKGKVKVPNDVLIEILRVK